MSEVDDLPYDEKEMFAAGYRKANSNRRFAVGNKWNQPRIEKVLERDRFKRNPPMTSPKLKFMNEV